MSVKPFLSQEMTSHTDQIIVTPLESATPAVARAACIMDLLAESRGPLSLAELSRMLAVPKSSLHTICSTLVDLRLIRRLDSGQMSLGPHVMNWANAFLSRSEITREFYSTLDEESILPLETITLSVLDTTNVVYIACREGTRPLGITFRIGMHLPAPFTATGKAMLSTHSDADVRRRFDKNWPARLTPFGVSSISAFLNELKEIRKRGHSFDRGEVREGMISFGAPIFDSSSRQAVAALAVSVLGADVNSATMRDTGMEAQKLADKLSERMGANLSRIRKVFSSP